MRNIRVDCRTADPQRELGQEANVVRPTYKKSQHARIQPSPHLTGYGLQDDKQTR